MQTPIPTDIAKARVFAKSKLTHDEYFGGVAFTPPMITKIDEVVAEVFGDYECGVPPVSTGVWGFKQWAKWISGPRRCSSGSGRHHQGLERPSAGVQQGAPGCWHRRRCYQHHDLGGHPNAVLASVPNNWWCGDQVERVYRRRCSLCLRRHLAGDDRGNRGDLGFPDKGWERDTYFKMNVGTGPKTLSE